MAIIATGSKTIIDLSDGKSLSAHLGTNSPKVQIYNPNVGAGTYTPDWGVTNVVITPFIYVNQQAIATNDGAIAIVWKRKDGVGSEVNLSTGESAHATTKIVTINQNKLSASPSGLLTYIAYITYTDPDTNIDITVSADITFSLVTSGENAKTAWISGDQVFKYDASGNVTPSSITLTANLQNVSMNAWQYKNSSGNWVGFSSPQTGQTISIAHNSEAFIGSSASIRVTTSDPLIGDTTSIYKVSDGIPGSPGTPGSTPPSPSLVFLTNESITFSANASGQIPAVIMSSAVVAYTGTTKVTPTVGTISGAPTGMSVSKGSANSNEIPLTITITANATLGGSGPLSGEISIPITAPIVTTLKLTWSKINTGATGAQAKAIDIVTSNQVFASADGGSNYTPDNIVLTPVLQNLTYSKWQYSTDGGTSFTDIGTVNGVSINGTTKVLTFSKSSTLFTSAINAVAFRVVATETSFHDTITIYRAASGLSGLTVVLSNEAHVFPAGNNGDVLNYAGSGTTIRLFEGATELDYDGAGTANGKWKVTATGTNITPGTLTDSGTYVTVGQHSAVATGTDLSSIAYTITGKRATGGVISLTATQTFTKAKQGNVGQNAVVLTIYSEDGTTFENGSGANKTLKVNAYDGSTVIAVGNASWKWMKLPSTSSIGTSNTLSVAASAVIGVAVYKLEMTYPTSGGKVYTDTITMVDKTDNYQAEVVSTGGNIFKNTQGETILTCRVYQNGVEVDPPKSSVVQENDPTGGASGQFYYKILKSGAIPRTTVLRKYTSSWGNASGSDLHTLTYNWYRWNKDGVPMNEGAIWAVGKCIYAGPNDVTDKTTFYCEVNK